MAGKVKRIEITSERIEVGKGSHIVLLCSKCRKMKPLIDFGLRTMPSGVARNQPWCSACRSAREHEEEARS